MTNLEVRISWTDIERTAMLVNSALNIPLALASIIGNTLVLHAVWRTPSLRSPSTLLLCGLAISDLTVGAIVQPLFVASILVQLYGQSQEFKELFHRCYAAVGFCLCGVSLCTIAAISVDRLIAIQKHLRYPCVVTTSRVRRIILAIWGICLLLASTQLWEQRILLVSIVFVVCICLCVSTICHLKIYKILRRHQTEIEIQVQAVESNAANINMASLHKSASNAFVVFVVLIICYCPYLVVYIVHYVSRMDSQWLARSLASTVVFINSALNPILYCWRLREMREVILHTCQELQEVVCKQQRKVLQRNNLKATVAKLNSV